MTTIQEHVNVQTILATAVALRAGFGLNCYLTDDNQIPVDMRYRLTTKESYSSDFPDTASNAFLYAQTFFSQAVVPTQLMIARHISQATSPFWAWGPSYEADFSVWAAITDAVFIISNSTVTDSVGPLNLSAATSMDDVISLLTTAIQAIAVPNIPNLNTAQFRRDATGRIILEHSPSQTGSAAAPIWITDGVGGTSIAPLMDYNNATTIVGYDAETLVESVAALRLLSGGDNWYNLNTDPITGVMTTTDYLALAQYIESTEKLLDLVTSQAAALSAGDTTTIGPQCAALSLKRTLCLYSEKVANTPREYPDAAMVARTLPLDEGSANFAFQTLSQVTASGDIDPLTIGEKANLIANGYNYIETIGTETYMYNGITCGNEEKRIMLGRDWFNARIREAIFADMLNSDIHAFDNPTITKVEGYIRDVATTAIERGILNNTEERPFTIDLPDADDIDAATRATHTFTDSDAFLGYINAAINDYLLTGKWQL